MKTKLFLTIVLIALVAMGCAAAAYATETEDARKVADTYKQAVVTVELVIETTMSYEGESSKRQGKISATGTVVDPSGIVVTSLSAVNPSEMLDRVNDGEEDSSFQHSSEVKDLKVKLDDGTEIPYDMVLRDSDLDLAYLRPKKAPEQPMAAIDLSQANVPQLMDQIVVLSRLGKIANRSLAGTIDRVQAVVTKPRKFFVMGFSAVFQGMGCPAFMLDGKPAGILVIRTTKGSDSDESSMSGLGFSGMIPIVLPCSDVAKAIEQAKTSAPEAPAKKPAVTEKKTTAPAKPAPKPTPKPAPKPAPKKPTK